MDCFRADADRRVYLLHIKELARAGSCRVHAYCLMTNHVHLLLTPSSFDGCIALMRNLGQRYVQYFNRRYDRSGTLWEGRFRSCVVESSTYVLACHRYIEMNPVRAGMTRGVGDYPWSSYLGNSGMKEDSLLTPHAEFEALGQTVESRARAYQALFERELPEEVLRGIRDSANGGYPLVEKPLVGVPGPRIERRRAGRPPKRGASSEDDQLEIGL